MTTITTVNCELPTVESTVDYGALTSLRPYDIIIFDPEFPYLDAIHRNDDVFQISMKDGEQLRCLVEHWKLELTAALKAGKTIFFLLNELESETWTNEDGNQTSGLDITQTHNLDNYGVLPLDVSVRRFNEDGARVADLEFNRLFDVIGEISQYKVVVEDVDGQLVFTERNGSGTGAAIAKARGCEGHIVFLPHFDLYSMISCTDDGEAIWPEEAFHASDRIVGQFYIMDRYLRKG